MLRPLMLVIVLASRSRSESACQFRLNKDIPKDFEPVYLVTKDNEVSFALPRMVNSSAAICLDEEQDILLSCPGVDNYLHNGSIEMSSTSSGDCSQGEIQIGQSTAKVSQLECAHRSSSIILPANVSCFNGAGDLLQIGFLVESYWLPLIEVCFSHDLGLSFYSKNTLLGESIQGKVTGLDRPDFRTGGDYFYPDFSPDAAYKIENQKEIFENIVGASEIDQYIDQDKELFLARGHYAPNADFDFGSWQGASFFYENVAPQWQIINGGHWSNVEGSVRDLAIKLGAELEVTTGSYGRFSLKGTQVSLNEGKLPVPGYYWKLVQYLDSCIVLLSTNDPFLTEPPEDLCPDICAQSGWPVYQNDLSKGYVICCDYTSFREIVPSLPSTNCSSVLTQ